MMEEYSKNERIVSKAFLAHNRAKVLVEERCLDVGYDLG